MALAIREPSETQVVVAPNPSDALNVSPPTMAKCPRLTKGEDPSFTPPMATSKEILGDQTPRFDVWTFDNWEVAKGLFKEFIHPIDSNYVMKEGIHQHREDAVWIALKVSFPFSF